MPCSLVPSTTGNEDFTIAVGANFTLDLTGPAGAGAVLVSAAYNGTQATAAPFTFTAAPGTKFLFVHFEALTPGAKLQIVQRCGAATQVIENLFFDPFSPSSGFEITGV